MNRARFSILLGLVLALTLLAGACAGDDPLAEGGASDEPAAGSEVAADPSESEAETQTAGGGGGPITVGSTNFAEQLILAEMFAAVLEQGGYDVDTRLNLGNREIVFPALEEGEIDVLPEYIGALSNFLSESGEEAGQGTEAVYAKLEEALPEGIIALETSEAQDKDALAVTAEFAEENGVETISDLAGLDMDLRLGGPPETETRFVGVPGLEEVYGLTFSDFTALDAGGPLTIRALQDGQIDVGRVFTTQGEIESEDLVVLEDDMELVPAENLVPVVREEAVDERARELLNGVMAELTDQDLVDLNAQVALEDAEPEAVARDFLTENGLLEE